MYSSVDENLQGNQIISSTKLLPFADIFIDTIHDWNTVCRGKVCEHSQTNAEQNYPCQKNAQLSFSTSSVILSHIYLISIIERGFEDVELFLSTS